MDAPGPRRAAASSRRGATTGMTGWGLVGDWWVMFIFSKQSKKDTSNQPSNIFSLDVIIYLDIEGLDRWEVGLRPQVHSCEASCPARSGIYHHTVP